MKMPFNGERRNLRDQGHVGIKNFSVSWGMLQLKCLGFTAHSSFALSQRICLFPWKLHAKVGAKWPQGIFSNLVRGFGACDVLSMPALSPCGSL